jgi:murein tripeptide amidase MpaA
MRVPDPNGPWKKHADEPRLMVRREPDEFGGEYYRLIPEGPIEDYDGIQIRPQRKKEGLDINRNFPAGWRQEFEQVGAGPYPTSEPEVRAVVDFVAKHNNINGGVSFHTMSGALLRPFGDKPDSDMPAEDLWTYKKVGAKGTELIGYPNISIFHDFKYHPQQVISGGFDWIYVHLGMFMWAVEIWSPQRQAGIDEMKFIEWYREHPIEDDFKLLKWSDEKLGGQGYVDWYPFEHPQLGPVELGGWDFLYAWRNPPLNFLESEIAPFTGWIIYQALSTPRLEVFKAEAKPLGGGSYRVTLALQNTGWLPTYTSKMALKNKTVRGVVAEINLPESATLETGKAREELGQLEGRHLLGPTGHPRSMGQPTADRLKVEWVIHAPAGGVVSITARHERAGVTRLNIELE